METQEAMERLASARHAYLATADADGRPHIVPVVFVFADGIIATAVDHKPKRSSNLKRHTNIAANGRVSVLVDSYSEQWDELWWVRADGNGSILEVDAGRRWISALQAKYEQYRSAPPGVPIILVTIDRITGWSGRSASDG